MFKKKSVIVANNELKEARMKLSLRRGLLRSDLKQYFRVNDLRSFLALTAEYQDVIQEYWGSLKRCPHCGEIIND
jgi:hypothetical protein